MQAKQSQTVDPLRVRALNARTISSGPVIYWMSRDQRLNDNWALIYATQQADQINQPVIIAFVLMPEFGQASLTHYQWMLDGLQEVAIQAQEHTFGFVVLMGEPLEQLRQLTQQYQAGLIVADMSPLRAAREDRSKLATLPVAVHEVDAHNIVPVWVASDRAEHAAYSLRPKLHRQLDRWLVEFPTLPKPVVSASTLSLTQELPIKHLLQGNHLKITVAVNQPKLNRSSGARAAANQLQQFIDTQLLDYAQQRNNPALSATSGLSPYLHFGQLSAQRVALAIQSSRHNLSESGRVFLEELIVRRELADNFCYFTPNYDSVTAFPSWAQATLREHESDPRPYSYSLEQLELGQTHDPLWNAAQQQMLKTGIMHGYIRMYWAKQLLRWTPTAERALELGLYLNDRYHLDGRDANGYTGLAWALGGVHDRPWPTQPIFGTVRSMSFASTSKKFNLSLYQQHVSRQQ